MPWEAIARLGPLGLDAAVCLADFYNITYFQTPVYFSGHLYHSVPDLLWGHPTAPLSVLPPPYPVAASSSFSSSASSHLALEGLPPGSRPSTLPQPLQLILPCLPSLITGQGPLHNPAKGPKMQERLKFLQKYTI